jgi:hypothetical protein
MSNTPPHHPTHNVRFSPAEISGIVAYIGSELEILSIEQLESGKSFNNRLYFIRLSLGQSASHLEAEEVVLKVSGQFFGPDKVQNEVACLYLLEQHCPLVPAPRVLAWSDGGKKDSEVQVVVRTEVEEVKVKQTKLEQSSEMNLGRNREHGWVLLSRLPERRLELSDLEGEIGADIARELAVMVAQFRTKTPAQGCFGNIRLKPAPPIPEDAAKEDDLFVLGPRLIVNGLLLCHHAPEKPTYSTLEYYQVRLQDQLTKLETEDVFASKRTEVSPLVRDFMTKSLPALHLFNRDTPARPTFTQYDFSPRNILVSGSPPHVTGLVDFEFAGFFPPEEEFANNAVGNEGDWPAPVYDMFLLELEKLGVETPLRGFSVQRWNEARLLMLLIEDIAPWYLREGGIKGGELEEECQKAADKARRCIEELKNASGV